MPRPVKVLILLANLAGGGAERTVVRLMENIDREKFQPKVGILWSEGPFLKAQKKGVPLKTPLALGNSGQLGAVLCGSERF